MSRRPSPRIDDAGRSWEDAVKYGFIGGGGGEFYVKTLAMLSPGDRVWVNVPGEGYVGVSRSIATYLMSTQQSPTRRLFECST